MADLIQANAIFSKFSRNYMNLKKDLPIRPSEMGVLNILSQTPGPHTALMLRDMLGVSKPMIAAHLSVLEKKGYLTKRQSSEDKRVFFILPTCKALELVERAKAEMQAQLDGMARQMGQNEFDSLVALLERANHALESLPEQTEVCHAQQAEPSSRVMPVRGLFEQ